MVVWLACVLGIAVSDASAQAFTSEPAEMTFEDTRDLFGFVQIDTGYLPSQSDPISVRFHVTPTGGIVTEMEAESNLEWPTAFKHSLEAIPGEGLFGIDTEVLVEFEVYINVASIYQSSLPVWSESFEILRAVEFDTLVLPGSPEYPLEVGVANTSLIDPFEYGIDVVPGVAGLELAVEIYPELSSTMGGNRIETWMGPNMGTQDGEGGFAQINPPGGNPGEVFLETTYIADLSTTFGIVIEPSATLDTIIGDFELVAFDIPVDVLSNDEERAFETEVYTHPLPALDGIDVPTDLGLVDLGDLANLEIPLENIGAMGLEGIATIEGNPDFSVWPEYFYATEGNVDGVVVTFEPSEPGEAIATLVLNSNDPVQPEVRIPITAEGFDPTPPENPDPVPDPPPNESNLSGEDVKGCGCAVQTGSIAPLWAGGLVLAGLFVRRRRE